MVGLGENVDHWLFSTVANPDVRRIEYAFKAQDGETIVMTSGVNDENYYNSLQAFTLKDGKMEPLGKVTEIDRLHDGGTTRGGIRMPNGKVAPFFAPTPFSKETPTIGGKEFEYMLDEEFGRLSRTHAKELGLPEEKSWVEILPGVARGPKSK